MKITAVCVGGEQERLSPLLWSDTIPHQEEHSGLPGSYNPGCALP